MGAVNTSHGGRDALDWFRLSRAAVARLWVACGLCGMAAGFGVLAGVGWGLVVAGFGAVAFGLTVNVDGGS